MCSFGIYIVVLTMEAYRLSYTLLMMKGFAFGKTKTVLRFLDASDSKVCVHCCNAYHLSLCLLVYFANSLGPD